MLHKKKLYGDNGFVKRYSPGIHFRWSCLILKHFFPNFFWKSHTGENWEGKVNITSLKRKTHEHNILHIGRVF